MSDSLRQIFKPLFYGRLEEGQTPLTAPAEAGSTEEIERQPTAHIQSNPWYDWIQAAKAQRQNQEQNVISPKRCIGDF